MKKFNLEETPFNLDLTVSCGQAFRWKKINDFWYAPVGESVWKVKQEEDTLLYEGASENELINYFALDIPLDNILKDIDRDTLIHSAVEQCRGLRILRQPKWECLVSYICATCANIPGITMRIENLSKKFGQTLHCDNMEFHTFPSIENIACEPTESVRECKVGYRDKFICGAAENALNNKHWSDEIASLDYICAKSKLMELNGVGPKVADCVLLFAFEKYEAIPVDVWIERILRTKYLGGDKKLSYSKASEYARNHFGKYAGYAQEYLFAERELISSKGE
ncbi:MAG: DNA glycosylase [Methanocorpusculum sp.]|nr:DNA glycosylase [Methanocorpusculum sp.]